MLHENGGPATGLRMWLNDSEETPDRDGAFRFEHVEPGYCLLVLESTLLAEFELLSGDERRVDAVIPRGTAVEGVVVTADDGRPAKGCKIVVPGSRWGSWPPTGSDGAFRIGWVPNGSHDILVYPVRFRRYATAVVSFDTETAEFPLQVELTPRAPLALRFENLPLEWHKSLPLVVWCFNDAGHCLTPPPTNAIGATIRGDRSTELGRDHRPVHSTPTPAPGAYRLALVDPYYPEVPWLEIPIVVANGPLGEIVFRIPDGAGVTIVSQNHGLETLAIGPACAVASRNGQLHFPRVPAGSHVIWSVTRKSLVRVGGITVPTGGEIRHELEVRDGHGKISGRVSAPVELRRATDDMLVAQTRRGVTYFWFSPLEPGHYVVVVGGRRIPIALTSGEELDLGFLGTG